MNSWIKLSNTEAELKQNVAYKKTCNQVRKFDSRENRKSKNVDFKRGGTLNLYSFIKHR